MRKWMSELFSISNFHGSNLFVFFLKNVTLLRYLQIYSDVFEETCDLSKSMDNHMYQIKVKIEFQPSTAHEKKS